MILETPEIAGVPDGETLILGRVEGVRGPEAAFATNVLDPVQVRAELRKFLEVHPELYQPWDGLVSLANRTDRASRLRRAELLLDEGRLDDASGVLQGIQRTDDTVRLLTGRAARLGGDLDAAASATAATARTAAADIERIRIAWAREDVDRARASLESFLAQHATAPEGAEAFYLRGILFHRAGDDDAALDTWRRGVRLHAPVDSLYGQVMELTRIRQNFELSDVMAGLEVH